MKAQKIILLTMLMTIAFSFGCKKEAGILGKKIISGTVYFKNGATGVYEKAPSAIIKIAYGTNTATSEFDQALLSDANGTYKLEGLTKGDYFITAEFTDIHGFKYITAGYSVTVKNKKEELVLDIMLE